VTQIGFTSHRHYGSFSLSLCI